MRILTVLATMLLMNAAERKTIGSTVPGATYSTAIQTGEYLYISGQVGRLADGKIAPTIEEQARILLDQIKKLVESARLSMDHVVYTNLFLTDIHNYEAVNKIYASYFPGEKPSRVTVGVVRLPFGAGVEINAVAVRDLAAKQSVTRAGGGPSVAPISEGIKTRDRFFLSGTLGRDAVTGEVATAEADQVRVSFRRAKATLRLANLTEESLVNFTVYYTPRVKRETIDQIWAEEFGKRIKAPVSFVEVNEMALGTNVGVTGVAALDRSHVRFTQGCASLGETVYCAVEQSVVSGSIEQQTQDSLHRLSGRLKRAGVTLADASSTLLYLGNIDDFTAMNGAYNKELGEPRPAQTTLQPAPTGNQRRLIQIAVIASRSH